MAPATRVLSWADGPDDYRFTCALHLADICAEHVHETYVLRRLWMSAREWTKSYHPRKDIDLYTSNDSGGMCREVHSTLPIWRALHPRPSYATPWVTLSDEDVDLADAIALYEEMFPFESPTRHWMSWSGRERDGEP